MAESPIRTRLGWLKASEFKKGSKAETNWSLLLVVIGLPVQIDLVILKILKVLKVQARFSKAACNLRSFPKTKTDHPPSWQLFTQWIKGMTPWVGTLCGGKSWCISQKNPVFLPPIANFPYQVLPLVLQWLESSAHPLKSVKPTCIGRTLSVCKHQCNFSAEASYKTSFCSIMLSCNQTT